MLYPDYLSGYNSSYVSFFEPTLTYVYFDRNSYTYYPLPYINSSYSSFGFNITESGDGYLMLNYTSAPSLAAPALVYVGGNITRGPYTVQLADLGTANSNGVSPAAINIYYYGVLTNSSSIYPGDTVKYDVSGTTVYVEVNQTFEGLYAYQKWAKIQFYNTTTTSGTTSGISLGNSDCLANIFTQHTLALEEIGDSQANGSIVIPVHSGKNCLYISNPSSQAIQVNFSATFVQYP